ncbi:GNAT family N-acetyltransferase [Fibrella sp. HMF5335]|uniref:GNAT family N-acetyltransferase n=1 Tax=Fibrella rubiginis TaxID=2817060 RepID=A0A939GBY3_9BACT|nr:GNAT family N-acetyltransferase [Fibrella rubiginis]MBO0936222.1 GNAT family N-acetyltransferase [Fibrella rubiginis]
MLLLPYLIAPPMHIRRVTPDDLHPLVALARRCYYEAFSPETYPGNPIQAFIDENVTTAIYAQEMTDRRASFWLAENEAGEPMGFLKLRRHAPPRRLAERNALELVRIYLLRQYIGKGYGQQLMQFCLDQARAQGHKAVYLGVWEHNAPAIAFYRRQGFVPFGWHVFPFGGERQRDIWMSRAV